MEEIVVKKLRYGLLASKMQLSFPTIQKKLKEKGIEVSKPTEKVSEEALQILKNAFPAEFNAALEKLKAEQQEEENQPQQQIVREEKEPVPVAEEKTSPAEKKEVVPLEVPTVEGLKVVGKLDEDKLHPERKKKQSKEKTTKHSIKQKNIEKAGSEVLIEEPVEDKKENVSHEIVQSVQETTEKEETVGVKNEEIIKTSQEEKKEVPQKEKIEIEVPKLEQPVVKGKIDLSKVQPSTKKEKTEPSSQAIEEKEEKTSEQTTTTSVEDDRYVKVTVEKLKGPNILGKIELEETKSKKETTYPHDRDSDKFRKKEKKRKRIHEVNRKPVVKANPTGVTEAPAKPFQKDKQQDTKFTKDKDFKKQRFEKEKKEFKKKDKFIEERPVVSDEDIEKHIKETLAKLQEKTKSKTSKYKRIKREEIRQQQQEQIEEAEKEKNKIKVSEFITVNELAALMDVPPVKLIQACMNLGVIVSLNQRLDAELISILAEEFGYEAEFVSIEEEIEEEDFEDDPFTLVPRPPVVTVMGHVDHGKTSLLDYIRKTNVIAGEAGGITQHIGAYEVTLENGRKITFLDTPGHEAFTAMRARGAKVTDVAIIVIAADDQVMPQTVEAINHAKAANVPMVFAINKIDKPTANPDRIREQLAQMNILVEDWGGPYQCQEISAKHGINVDKLLEKVLLESDLLDLKANPNRPAVGTIIESSLDKGRGYTATVLVHKGTLRIGDIILAGPYYGRVKAMFNERNQPIEEAGPSTPAVVLGLDGAPAAGDKLVVYLDEHKAKEVANKRKQILREQSLRTKKHITLDEIGRRIAIGDFKELNFIVKGDVDGSVEALSDALLKLSTEKVSVNVIHKAVGGITESDVLLASASNAIIIGFNVRPTVSARKLAESEQIEIRTYNIIYDAVEQVKDAIEGMLEPTIIEKTLGSADVREIFKISKVGTVAGCFVLDGKITRTSKVHLLRNGIVIHTGSISSLKRFKDDVKEVLAGQECGIALQNYQDIKVGDIIEAFIEEEKK